MKIYITKNNDTFADIAQKFNIKDENYLKTFHNLSCHQNDIIHGELKAGKQICIPEDQEFLANDKSIRPNEDKNSDMQKTNTKTHPDNNESSNEDSSAGELGNTSSKNQKETKKTEEENKDSKEHDGKYFVIQKGICQCNQGFKFPRFKVTSHQKHYWNNAEGQDDYLAVTEDDLQFDPSVQPFGQCKLKPSSGGYLPCTYAPAGKWQKTYEKVKVMGKSCLTEISELMCTTGGKITVLKHGQQNGISKTQIANADSQEQNIYNPVVNIDELKEEIDIENSYAH